ncbi:MAG: NAD(P)-dependent oxidoreductase [Ignisphaera sp.]
MSVVAFSGGGGSMKHRIGIVGGSGYIGYSLAKFLSKKFHVKILDIKQPKQVSNNIEYMYCDIRNFEQVKNCLSDVDLVIHTAIIQIPSINEQKKLGYEINVIGTQNVCESVNQNSQNKGLILAGSWHVMGERELKGNIDESFGYRPDKVEDRARLYAISKIIQENIVRFYDEMSEKIFGVIRMGTVLGDGMPEKTAANIFIERGLKGDSITPFKHSMYRPMLYVDIDDVCKAFEKFSLKILNYEVSKETTSLAHIINLYYPKPITILELAKIVQKAIIKHSNGAIKPRIEIVDSGQKSLFSKNDVKKIKVNVTKAINFLGLDRLKSPEESIDELVKKRIKAMQL